MSLSSDNQWGQLRSVDKKVLFKGFVCNGFTENLSPHTMPQPTGLPWNIQDMSWSVNGAQRGVMEFTALPFDSQNRNKECNALHCKRKSESLPNVPTKKLLTEEKMAAYFDGMHISADYQVHEREGEAEGGMEVEASSSDRLRGVQRLVLSEEMMRIKNEPILPDSILQRIEKPCTSLVLWQPPKKLVLSSPDKDPNNNPDSGSPKSPRRSVLVPTSSTASMDMDM